MGCKFSRKTERRRNESKKIVKGNEQGIFVTVKVGVIGVLEDTVGSWPSKHVFHVLSISVGLTRSLARAYFMYSMQ